MRDETTPTGETEMTTEARTEARRDDGHEHTWSFASRCTRCGYSVEEIAGMIEPARIVQADPADLLQWEDGQDLEHVARIAAAMTNGEAIPAILVSEDGSVLYDGHHRVAAAKMANVSLTAVAVPMSWRRHGIAPTVESLRWFAQLTTSGVVIG